LSAASRSSRPMRSRLSSFSSRGASEVAAGILRRGQQQTLPLLEERGPVPLRRLFAGRLAVVGSAPGDGRRGLLSVLDDPAGVVDLVSAEPRPDRGDGSAGHPLGWGEMKALVFRG